MLFQAELFMEPEKIKTVARRRHLIFACQQQFRIRSGTKIREVDGVADNRIAAIAYWSSSTHALATEITSNENNFYCSGICQYPGIDIGSGVGSV